MFFVRPYCSFKGEVRQKKILAQSFYRPQTKTSLKRQFSSKSPEGGQKLGQRVKKSRNKAKQPIQANSLGIHQFRPTATVGIHFLLVGGLLQ